MYKKIALGTLLILATHSAHTSTIPDDFWSAKPRIQLYMAYAQFKMGQYENARNMWLSIKGKGESEALFNLGILYEQGKGVDRDVAKATDYYLWAAESGSRAAAYQLGLLHSVYPDHISRNEATHWLTVAAIDGDQDAAELLAGFIDRNDTPDTMTRIRQFVAKGENALALEKLEQLAYQAEPNVDALVDLAWLYEAGLGVEQDIEKAGSLFLRAANLGDSKAQYAVAVMFETGVGQQQDCDKARHYLKLSADQGYQPALAKFEN